MVFFLGAQINCSTTIHNRTDILRVLSMSEDVDDDKQAAVTSPRGSSSGPFQFLKHFKTHKSDKRVEVREAGMEQGLLGRIEKMTLDRQMRMFYTAYSRVRLMPSFPPRV